MAIHRGQGNPAAVALDEGVKLLGADEPLNSAQDTDYLTALGGIAGCAHEVSVPSIDLHFGIIPTMVVGMIPKKALFVLTLAACTLASALAPALAATASSKFVIVAGVSEWGALARQLVGRDATVVSLLTDPNADPHEHEATVSDAEHVAVASIVLVNGAGYDTWLSKLIGTANPKVTQVNVGSIMGVKVGSNPHLFYNPVAAIKFVTTLTSLLESRRGFSNLKGQSAALLGQLEATQKKVASIKAACANVKVAATEDVASYLLRDAGLNIVTPKALRLAVGNGVDPSVKDLALALQQLKAHPAFLIDNIQTATPLTTELVAQAKSSHVPIINVTETMTGSSFVTFLNHVVTEIGSALQRNGCLS